MSLHWSSTIKILLWYLLVYTMVVVLLFIGLRWWKQKNFSTERVEQMMSMVSSKRDKTHDPCRYSILGDPTTAGKEFIKVYLYCNYPEKVTNTVDLRVLKDDTFINVLNELGRINGFDVAVVENKIKIGKTETWDDWQCFEDEERIMDYNAKVKPEATIDCFKNVEMVLIKSQYEKN